jgi:phospholipid/cholesterol/gamma-HCH transport system substrate-binding protein
METNVNYTLVGIFVISLLSAIIIVSIWLSAGLSFQQYTFYRIYMKESVSGLSVDSPVEFNGVNVGSVKKVELEYHDPQTVKILLSLKSSTPVTSGTVATLNVKGLTGIAFVALRDTGQNLQPLKATGGEPYPVIKTAPSFFMQVDKALKQLNDNIHEVSQSIKTLLDKENLASIKHILINMRLMTDTIAGNRFQLESVMRNTATASQLFSSQTLPVTNQTISNIDSISAMIKQNPSVLIRGTEPQALGPGEQ